MRGTKLPQFAAETLLERSSCGNICLVNTANENTTLEFRLKLRDEFSRRLRANERYSIRAFAQAIGVDSSTLSQMMSGTRPVSLKKMKEISSKLGLTISTEAKASKDFSTLDLDAFSVISDWHHFAILDLTLLKTFKSDEKWIARKLGLTLHETVAAVERLKRLGMLVEEKGKLKKGKDFYTNYSEGQTSAALKEYQRQVIKKSLHAVDNCAQDRKDITSITIAADSKKLKEAKERIKKFRRELCAFLEDGDRDSVFHLALQLYPVTEIEN